MAKRSTKFGYFFIVEEMYKKFKEPEFDENGKLKYLNNYD